MQTRQANIRTERTLKGDNNTAAAKAVKDYWIGKSRNKSGFRRVITGVKKNSLDLSGGISKGIIRRSAHNISGAAEINAASDPHRRPQAPSEEAAQNVVTEGKASVYRISRKSVRTGRKAVKAAIKPAEEAAMKLGRRLAVSAIRGGAGIAARLFKAVVSLVSNGAVMLATAAGGAAAALSSGLALILIIVLVAASIILGGDIENLNAADAIFKINLKSQKQLQLLYDGQRPEKILVTGQRAAWEDVLPAFYVKYLDEPLVDLSDFSEGTVKALEYVYWDMQRNRMGIDDSELVLDADGKRVLDLNPDPYTPEDYAETYLNKLQKDLLQQYAGPDYREQWKKVIYGTSRPSIADVAKTEFGAPGGERFWRDYYKQPGRWEWCAIFVSYCIHSSVLDESVPENYGSVMEWWNYFGNNQRRILLTETNNQLPQAGWIIFYNWWEQQDGQRVQDAKIDHIAVVISVDEQKGTITVIGGNEQESCLVRDIKISELYSYGVVGYGFFIER